MKSADIKVGGFYAVKDYSDKQGARAQVLAVGVSRWSETEPGRLVRVQKPASNYSYTTGPAQILREWTEADDERIAAHLEATQRAIDEKNRLKELIAEVGLGDVAHVSYRGFEISNANAIRLLERLR